MGGFVQRFSRFLQVGLMRSGRMLAEDEPTKLLEKYQQNVCSIFHLFIFSMKKKMFCCC